MTHSYPDSWKYYVDVQLWPIRVQFDPYAWISNFTESEEKLAKRLLQGFVHYSDTLTTQMFKSAFNNISQLVVSNKNNFIASKKEWQQFIDSLIVVRVTGEEPSDADSGYIFIRLARDILKIPEAQILTPERALQELTIPDGNNVLFVDDFVGSGNQFVETWERPYNTGYAVTSFKEVAAKASTKCGFFYCPVICSYLGREKIEAKCPEVKILPAHFWEREFSALSPDSTIWGKDMNTEGPDFIEQASIKAGIPDLSGKVGCWRGFNKLGFALAFEHGCPDATLPLFTWNKNGWKPLIRKVAA